MVEKKKTITDKKLVEWAKKNYPDFANNLELMTARWESEQGIKPVNTRDYVDKEIKDIVNSEFAGISVLIAKEQFVSQYMGCVECRRKMERCRCANPEFVEYTWKHYVVGDKTGTALAKILYPSTVEIVEVGKVYKLKVRADAEYVDKHELMVNEIEGGEVVEDNGEIKEINKELADYWDVFPDGRTEEKFQKWVEKSDFGIPYDKLIEVTGIVKKDGKVYPGGE